MKQENRGAGRLILVGTVHRDPDGLQKTAAFLDFFRPDLVCVEMSPYALRFRRKNRRRLKEALSENLHAAAAQCGLSLPEASDHPQVVAIRAQIALPFEYQATRAYASKTGAKHLLVDDSSFSRQWISSWAELISPENLAALLRTPPRESPVPRLYADAARRIIGTRTPSPVKLQLIQGPAESVALWEKRERFMARRILEGIARFSSRRPLYLGGWRHLCTGESPPTLRGLLAVDATRCCLIEGPVPRSLAGPLSPVGLPAEPSLQFHCPATRNVL